MGRIKTQLVKRTALKLMQIHPDKFKSDFQKNKPILAEVCEFHSKKIRNTVAGYLARLVKQKETKR